ncbi:MAG: cytochrome c [Reyranellaceae bacterium]
MIARLTVLILLVASLSPVTSLAQDQAAVRRGLAVSEQRCAACHAVHAGESASRNPAAASFARVAATPGVTELALQAMLQTSHQAMPNLIIGVDDMRDVIAYILSLRGR